MNKEIIAKKVEELKNILAFFAAIESPQFSEADCPLKGEHYDLSKVTSGIGRWGWNCVLCGKEYFD